MQEKSTPLIKQFVGLIKLKSFEDSESAIEAVAQTIISNLNLNLVEKFIHNFQPGGSTTIFVLSQSHLVIHTWPEYNTVHIDLVACVEKEEGEFKNALESAFDKYNPTSIKVKSIEFDSEIIETV
ncbi:MAG TPA: S-adenosylmethionine decarboxylase [Patescibacteria group bacterium]|nr:S-adenosylmethionine decarboxylase [Patescibacteria group bacterium]